MKTLNVMDLQFNYKAAIQGYESVVINRIWNGIGTISLVISGGITNTDLIKMDDILWFDNEYHKAFIIEKMETTLDAGVTKYTITGSHINTLLRDFISIPPADAAYDIRTSTREGVVRAWVNQNCISDIDRNQYPIILGINGGLGTEITDQTAFTCLSDEIIRILTVDDLGWALVLDIPNKQFIFNVWAGLDRTSAQSVNNRVLFGLSYGNIANYRKVNDNMAAKTVAYVAGQGEGVYLTIIKVSVSGTGRNKETFIFASDTNDTVVLSDRGTQALIELGAIDTFEFDTLNRQFTYEYDYNLGDFVTIVMAKDSYQHLQIQRVKEVYERGNITVTPEFGKAERTIGGIINAVSRRLDLVETTH